MSKPMFCPVKFAGLNHESHRVRESSYLVCEQEKCAWWIEGGGCSIPAAAKKLLKKP